MGRKVTIGRRRSWSTGAGDGVDVKRHHGTLTGVDVVVRYVNARRRIWGGAVV